MRWAWGRTWRYGVALVGLVSFGGIVALQHALQPGLSPRTHEISEYANGDPGWLMVTGFVAWAVSLTATAALVAAGQSRPRKPIVAWGRVVTVMLAAVGMLLTACFATQTSAGKLPEGVRLSLGGRLHDLGSGIATLGIIAAALLSVLNGDGTRLYRRVTLGIVVVAVVSDVALLRSGANEGGVRQRILLVCAGAWQLLALRHWERSVETAQPPSLGGSPSIG